MERNVEVTYVKLKRLRVMSFSAAENTADIGVLFNDGKERELACKFRVEEPKLMVAKFWSELKAVVENEYTDFDGEVLTNEVIALLHDQARTEAMLLDFFQTVYSNVLKVRHATRSEGYLNMVRALRSTELAL